MRRRVTLPESLRGVFFDHVWDRRKIWDLETPVSTMRLDDLLWHLDLTVWTTVKGEPRFDLSPRTVLRNPNRHRRRWKKIENADLTLPLEMFYNGASWVVVDGYHRLCRHFLSGSNQVPVRFHPDECWEQVERG